MCGCARGGRMRVLFATRCRYSSFVLLSWYKSTNTDAAHAHFVLKRSRGRGRPAGGAPARAAILVYAALSYQLLVYEALNYQLLVYAALSYQLLVYEASCARTCGALLALLVQKYKY